MDPDVLSTEASPLGEQTPSSSQAEPITQPALSVVPPTGGDAQPAPDAPTATSQPSALNPEEQRKLEAIRKRIEENESLRLKYEQSLQAQRDQEESARLQAEITTQEREYLEDMAKQGLIADWAEARKELAKYRHSRAYLDRQIQTIQAPLEEEKRRQGEEQWFKQSRTNFESAVEKMGCPELKKFSHYAVLYQRATGRPENEILDELKAAAEHIAEQRAPKPKENPVLDFIQKAGSGSGGSGPRKPSFDVEKVTDKWGAALAQRP